MQGDTAKQCGGDKRVEIMTSSSLQVLSIESISLLCLRSKLSYWQLLCIYASEISVNQIENTCFMLERVDAVQGSVVSLLLCVVQRAHQFCVVPGISRTLSRVHMSNSLYDALLS